MDTNSNQTGLVWSLSDITSSAVKDYLRQVLSIDPLFRAGITAESVFLAVLWINLYLTGPVWVPRVQRVIYGLKQLTRRNLGTFMRGYGPQIAALAREVAGLRNRLSFLWNTERARRAGIRQEGGSVPQPQQPVPAASSAIPAHQIGQFSFVFVFVAGSTFGGLVTASSICLGIWVGRLLSAAN